MDLTTPEPTSEPTTEPGRFDRAKAFVERHGGWKALLTPVGTPLGLTAALATFLWQLDGHVAIRDWMFWDFFLYWVLALFWSTSCAAIGHFVVRRVLPDRLGFHESVAISFGVGVFVFFLAQFLAGLAGLLGTVWFFALPLAFLAIGGPGFGSMLLAWRRHTARVRRSSGPTPAWTYLALAFGVVVLGLIYFLILSPANISFDARWKHLAIAEHYVELGRVAPFAEGWYPGTAPHLASFLYAWAFAIPGRALPDQLGLAAHMEYVAFLWTLVGIPALVRRILPDAGVRLTWVVRFLYPGVLVYDSSLNASADHLSAIFAAPIFLLLLRAWKDLRPRVCVLLAMMLAGGMLTKYSSAISLFLFPVLAVLVRAAWLAVRGLRRPDLPKGHWIAGPLAALAAGVILTAPHWLKNWLWYGDPLYPGLYKYFSLTPWVGDAAQVFRYGYMGQAWAPTKDWEGLVKALKVVFTFSFVPHNWTNFHGRLPVFGSLLTLSLFALPFLRANRRVWGLYAMIHVGVFSWYWIHHQDRHLQTLMPLIAGATAAAIVLVWRTGVVSRVLMGALIVVQVVWAGDVYFFPTHNIARKPLEASADLMASTFRNDPAQRVRTFGMLSEVREALPDDAFVLLHDIHMHAGLGAPSISDHQGWQGGISYGHLHHPGAIWDELKRMGVTHVLYPERRSRAWDSLAGDVAIFDFFEKHLVNPKRIQGHVLAELPEKRPEGEGPALVYVHGCGNTYEAGQYRFEDLRVPAFGPRRTSWPKPLRTAEGEERRDLIAASDYLLVEKDCPGLDLKDRAGFRRVATRRRQERIPYAYESTKAEWEILRNVGAQRTAQREEARPVLRPGAAGHGLLDPAAVRGAALRRPAHPPVNAPARQD